tara:strand:- start:1171 stop:1326 length:156 start_codon:yes stop_codon:yes gene_type:complete
MGLVISSINPEAQVKGILSFLDYHVQKGTLGINYIKIGTKLKNQITMIIQK